MLMSEKQRMCLPLYNLQEEIAGEGLRTHDLTRLAAYQMVWQVIENAFTERPDAPIAEVKRWLAVYPVRTSENRVEAEIVSVARRKIRELQASLAGRQPGHWVDPRQV